LPSIFETIDNSTTVAKDVGVIKWAESYENSQNPAAGQS
jgi:hypothetical protein